MANRTATILADTVTVPPRWLSRLLDTWDHDGTLDEHDPAEITQRVRGIVSYRDRWAVQSDDPLGDPPTDPLQQLEWSATSDLMIGCPAATIAVVE